VQTVAALINVGLARGLVGRERRGLVPIRGHSGVQGGAEVGCVPFLDAETARRWSETWRVPISAQRGWTASEMVEHAASGDVDLFWIVGGNFLETLAGRGRTVQALKSPRLRIHHDIVLSSSMLVESDGDVLILPATTRYESPGGGTETSTERRIIFSPEVPGRRVGDARAEWWAFGEAMARAFPDRAECTRFSSAEAIRDEIARAVPLYRGIETLRAKGDQVQWGGRTLFTDGRFATSDGMAHFAPVRLRPGHGESVASAPDETTRSFRLSTRRGKQFNSMIQRDIDPLTGASRDDVMMSEVDRHALGLRPGQTVVVRSAFGHMVGRVRPAAIKRGNLEVHWPEGNALLPESLLDPDSLEPDYNATVTVEALRED
jgi:predicted molibdopterin-dependent oxidoreductase YjgC